MVREFDASYGFFHGSPKDLGPSVTPNARDLIARGRIGRIGFGRYKEGEPREVGNLFGADAFSTVSEDFARIYALQRGQVGSIYKLKFSEEGLDKIRPFYLAQDSDIRGNRPLVRDLEQLFAKIDRKTVKKSFTGTKPRSPFGAMIKDIPGMFRKKTLTNSPTKPFRKFKDTLLSRMSWRANRRDAIKATPKSGYSFGSYSDEIDGEKLKKWAQLFMRGDQSIVGQKNLIEFQAILKKHGFNSILANYGHVGAGPNETALSRKGKMNPTLMLLENVPGLNWERLGSPDPYNPEARLTSFEGPFTSGESTFDLSEVPPIIPSSSLQLGGFAYRDKASESGMYLKNYNDLQGMGSSQRESLGAFREIIASNLAERLGIVMPKQKIGTGTPKKYNLNYLLTTGSMREGSRAPIIGSELIPGLVPTSTSGLSDYLNLATSREDHLFRIQQLQAAAEDYARNGAVFQAFMKNTDAHQNNVMFDPKSGKFITLDMGSSHTFSFGSHKTSNEYGPAWDTQNTPARGVTGIAEQWRNLVAESVKKATTSSVLDITAGRVPAFAGKTSVPSDMLDSFYKSMDELVSSRIDVSGFIGKLAQDKDNGYGVIKSITDRYIATDPTDTAYKYFMENYSVNRQLRMGFLQKGENSWSQWTNEFIKAFTDDQGNIGYAKGGMVKPKFFAKGGMVMPQFFAKGGDVVPAMLTPGEFVVNKHAVEDYGVNNLRAINSGTAPGNSVYNGYNINVNVKSNSNPDQIANAVMTQIRQVNAQQVRGNRFNG
jgi:hypothetical protein